MLIHPLSDFYTVTAEKGELHTPGGNVYPREVRVGIVTKAGKVRVWDAPRGYREAAVEVLEDAREKLIDEGKVSGKKRHSEARGTRRVMASHDMHSRNFHSAYGGRAPTTLARAKEHLSHLGVVLSKKDGEYRVRLRGAGPDEGYYTDDLADAVATGEYMHRERGGK